MRAAAVLQRGFNVRSVGFYDVQELILEIATVADGEAGAYAVAA